MVKELGLKNRSYRRFFEEKKLEYNTLKDLVDIGRNTPSGANKQPIRYKIVCDETMNQKVFECLGWAGYYKDWAGPEEGERPTGYIIMVTPTDSNAACDEGIAGQTMMLAAVEQGFGGCFLGNIQRNKLAEVIELPDGYKIDLCLAFGYPKEIVVLEDIPADGDYVYYRDADMVQHVPKKKLDDILL